MVQTNEELVALLQQATDKEQIKALTTELWQNNVKLINKIIYKYAYDKGERMIKAGVTIEDITNECYFALLNAIEHYPLDCKYKFTTYLQYPIRNTINNLLGYRTVAGYKDLLTNSTSTDIPVTEDNETTLYDILEDKNAKDGFDIAYYKEMQINIDKAIQELEPFPAGIIRKKFYEEIERPEILKQTGLTKGKLQNILVKTYFILRQNKNIQQYKENYTYNAYKSTGIQAFFNMQCSSVERTVEKKYHL